MKIKEIITPTKQVLDVKPSVEKQQGKVLGVVNQIAASDAQQPPTELEKVLAMRQMAAMKKRTNLTYAQRLRQQLANAVAATR